MSYENHIERAIKMYINENESHFNPFHGKNGRKRAELLLKMFYEINHKRSRKDFIHYYINQDFLSLRHTYSMYSEKKDMLKKKSNFLAFSENNSDENIRELLAGANHKNSLRTYVKNSHMNYINSKKEILSVSPSNINASLFGKNFDKFSKFDDLLKEHTIKLNDLKHVRDLGVSAHPVGMYELNDNNLKTRYFVKRFNTLDLSEYNKAIEDALAEIIYCNIWRYFIGNRASKSVLVINENNKIEGIASEGLDNFKEFAEINPTERYEYHGLATILFYSYILCEQDLHIYNYGISEQFSTSHGKFLYVYCKIDHDYIISKLSSMKPLVQRPLDPRVYNSDYIGNKITLFKELISTMRFTPGKSNLPLVAAHTLRKTIKTSTKVTATTGKILDAFEQATKSNYILQEEIKYCFTNFISKVNNQGVNLHLDSLENLLKNFSDSSGTFIQRRHINKALVILDLFRQRFNF
ncbi:hypothetical protein IB642_07065 [Allofrancisella guangzhouensis]|uniref:hypothetical protein n=1 Tax=Allofrancisella guangzhouensis TaxID=594679 RepID=UPI00190708CF|nr:hypothetical protein [Allofrancisella guangzhouensis]MBK2044778.1 hypothetical protein [Allofrancisella guangzhouensis]MBK2046378.1 hypothetical protein [Allofrancisella guangzhouensis]